MGARLGKLKKHVRRIGRAQHQKRAEETVAEDEQIRLEVELVEEHTANANLDLDAMEGAAECPTCLNHPCSCPLPEEAVEETGWEEIEEFGQLVDLYQVQDWRDVPPDLSDLVQRLARSHVHAHINLDSDHSAQDQNGTRITISEVQRSISIMTEEDEDADSDRWLPIVVTSLVNSIPLEETSPHCIPRSVLSCTPLHGTKDQISNLLRDLDLENYSKYDVQQKRNVCLVLRVLAKDLIGHRSVSLFTEEVQQFLIGNLNPDVDPRVTLFALLALENFALTRWTAAYFTHIGENKSQIVKTFETFEENPVQVLERWHGEDDAGKRQVGFYAQWLVDNIFLVPERKFGYEFVDTSTIKVILKTCETSEQLKISPNGLEARNDSDFFETARSTFQFDSGAWYYEAMVVTEGLMQIGWGSNSCYLRSNSGEGVGDDQFSVGCDLARRVIWFNGPTDQLLEIPRWKPGDILGTSIDLEQCEIKFYLNGMLIHMHADVFNNAKTGFFAAASFSSSQQCVFNFGASPFKYFPTEDNNGDTKRFQSFNQHASLDEESRRAILLPRHLRRPEYLRRVSNIVENACMLCFSEVASIRLLPCLHSMFCSTCADQLEDCPLCRESIRKRIIFCDAPTQTLVTEDDYNLR